MFRFDTFGDESFWGDRLKLHLAIEGGGFGGVGSGVSPKTALAVGLKVDVDALPGSLVSGLKQGRVNLDDPGVTLELLRHNAVVGLTGFFDGGPGLRSIGLQCSLCHSTVDNSVAPGIGRRLDGWAARAGFGNVRNTPDLITAKLPALHFYQLALSAPIPPEGSFDRDAALRGKHLFENNGRCAGCHVPPVYTEPGWNMHTAKEIGIDEFQANRAPDKRYRTSPLKGLWTHTKGGFYHDGRFATLGDVVNHYDDAFGLALTEQEKDDLVEYLKSL